jgi:hypothetical protein
VTFTVLAQSGQQIKEPYPTLGVITDCNKPITLLYTTIVRLRNIEADADTFLLLAKPLFNVVSRGCSKVVPRLPADKKSFHV